MDSNALSVNHRMQRTATLAQQVLERAKTRKLNWPLPPQLQRRTFRVKGGTDEDASLDAAFASFAEHMGCISADCENYYCSMPPFQFEEHEVAHIFRYHSKEASENLLRAFENEENKNAPIVEEPEYHKTQSAALIPAKTSTSKEICIKVSPGTYTISTSSYDDTIREAHLVNVQPGQSVNLTFHL
ncbi:uncharacterized protein LOC103066641 isoform X1 [Python bivittatus]|uniref:Uncharacterized protein LOC103066641 isoform X1 n=1 Tax=Python bivittatus TaxID=176946 RepID=A0A9F3QSP0_PYTBI|nr:uncharacterized protein LOC103066641 isoform X1 [Python bivittatus]